MACFHAIPIVILAGLVAIVAPAPPAHALDEADRVYLVGGKAFEDRLYPLSRRMLERFLGKFPSDPREGTDTLLLGLAQLPAGTAVPAALALTNNLAQIPEPVHLRL